MLSDDEDIESGFSTDDIHFARQTFYRDCPDGRCSKQKFLAFIRKSHLQKPVKLNVHTIKIFQNYRQSRKFFSMMFDIYDRNHDGELDFNEYLYALSAISGANRLRTIETLFNFFDVHNQGFLTREEFNSRKKLAAQFLGRHNDNSLYEKAFNEMDLDKDGQISKEEFIQWHLKENLTVDNTKSTSKRTRLLRNLSSFVDIRGEIKTSSLQQDKKDSVDHWLETTMNINHPNDLQNELVILFSSKIETIFIFVFPRLSSTVHADRYLLKMFRRARNRFYHERSRLSDTQSDSGVVTSSSQTTFTDHDCDINSLFELDDNDTNDTDSELLCQSLEVVLMETLLHIQEQRKRLSSHRENSLKSKENQRTMVSRL